MNKVYCVFSCDKGHSWKVSETLQETSDKAHFCSFGHEAIIVKEYEFIDDVVITFHPAGISDTNAPNKVLDRGMYYIIISNIEGTESLTSTKKYWWKEAVEICQRLDKRSFQEALKFWAMWKP